MICPFCSSSLKYKERSGRRCSKCRHIFAFEPRQNVLKLNDLRFRRVTSRLSQQGRLFYTAEQLCYTLNRPVVKPKRRSLLLVFVQTGMILVIGSIISLVGFQQPLLLLAVLLLTPLPFLAYRRPAQPQLALDPAAFGTTLLGRWREIYHEAVPGLIGSAPPIQAPPLPQLRAVLVCPVLTIRLCLSANRLPARLGLGLVPAQPPFNPAERSLLDYLRTHPRLPILLLHDGSPDGCHLAVTLRSQLGLSANHRLIDLGLHPRHRQAKTAMVLWRRLTPEHQRAIGALKEAGRLEEADANWFAQGLYLPLPALPPTRLIAMVEGAVKRHGLPVGAPPPARQDAGRVVGQAATAAGRAASAERAAQAIGFLSWPGPL